MRSLSSTVLRLLALFSLFVLLPAPSVRAQPRPLLNAAEIELALRKLSVVGSVLYVGAHPDDENTALLAYLSTERGARTAYLSLTRGDGGQNLIGAEQGALLGLVRTEELLAARRIDGAEQFFTRAVDFGFSKSPAEALQVWGREAALSDVVWVIRQFRPDLVITRFPTTGEGGHGHHTASAILALEAFEAAADPARFPEQLKYVEAWRPKRVLWNVFRPPAANAAATGGKKLLTVDVGSYNALLGKSYTEIAAASRSMHKSQGFGSAERRGSALNYFEHLKGEPPTSDIFDGVDTSWRRVAGGESVRRILDEALRTYRADDPAASLPLLLRAYRELSVLVTKVPNLDPAQVGPKLWQLREVIRSCAGLWIENIAAEPYVTPGGEVRVTTTLINRSAYPLRLERISMSYRTVADERAWKAVNAELKNNQPVQTETIVRVPADAEPSQPYWLRHEPERGLFRVETPGQVGQPGNGPVIPVTLEVAFGPEGETVHFQTEVSYRWVDRVRGEQYRALSVVPPVAVNLSEKVLVFPDRAPKQLRLTLRNNAGRAVAVRLRLRAPAGWRVSPESLPFTLKEKAEEASVTFNVTPPATLAADSAVTGTLTAEFDSGPGFDVQTPTVARGMTVIDYPHIPARAVFPTAEARLVRLDLKRGGGVRVGYVMGSGDEVPEALSQVGYRVTLLSDEDLASADLSVFDAVVTGVRAYNTRPRLRASQSRLLEYVERGGTLVVQYNTPEQTLAGFAFGPYPFKLSQERVTDEGAPVALVAPQDALLSAPNRITPADFAGWVQERGLNFPSEWDARYTPLLASRDPGEAEKRGGTLVARHGKGVYVYTSYAFFRQLPAGVPGAYRLFVNLISAGKN